MSFSVIIILLLAHWIADFVFQKESWALNKNNSFVHLIFHTFAYTLIISVILEFYLLIITSNLPAFNEHIFFYKISLFAIITFVTHTIIDFLSSKVTHKLSEKKKYYTSLPNFGFFSIIGLDQLIHYIILFATYKFLFL